MIIFAVYIFRIFHFLLLLKCNNATHVRLRHTPLIRKRLFTFFICLPEVLLDLRFQTAGTHLRKQWPHLHFAWSLWGASYFFIIENDYIQWLFYFS